MKKLTKSFGFFVSTALLSFSFPTDSYADSYIETIPTAWRLQDYLDGAIVAWYTGSSCTSGRITLLSSASEDIKQRFWSLILTAKVSQKKVGVDYSVDGYGNCVVQNFYFMEG